MTFQSSAASSCVRHCEGSSVEHPARDTCMMLPGEFGLGVERTAILNSTPRMQEAKKKEARSGRDELLSNEVVIALYHRKGATLKK